MGGMAKWRKNRCEAASSAIKAALLALKNQRNGVVAKALHLVSIEWYISDKREQSGGARKRRMAASKMAKIESASARQAAA